MAYEKIVSVASTATSGQVPQADGAGGFNWGNVEVPESGVQMELLWENASPTSEFAAQTISIDLSNYNIFMIIARPNNQYPRLVSEICIIGGSFVISTTWADNGEYHARAFNGSVDGVEVEAGYKDNSKNNNAMVPIYIYGIQGVITE